MEREAVTATRKKQLETMAVFALLALLFGTRLRSQLLVYLAMGFLVIALFVPPLARLITRIWLKFSIILGSLSNKVLLTIMFYLILTPLAFLYRLFNKDPLRLARKGSGSYYCERNQTYTRADLQKMW